MAPSLRSPAFNKPIKNPARTGGIGAFRERHRDTIQRAFTLRIQSLASVDDAVQQTVNTLKATGQYDDTVLMFMSDNGFILGENGKYAKVAPQRNSVRVPLLIAGPGFGRGETSNRWATVPDAAALPSSASRKPAPGGSSTARASRAPAHRTRDRGPGS